MGKRHILISNEQYEKMLGKYHNESYQTLAVKAKEYSRNGNRFHNFDFAMMLMQPLGTIDTAEKAAFCLMVKQLVSIYDILIDPSEITEELLKEKFGDESNYMFLIRGILERKLIEKDVEKLQSQRAEWQ
jgi:hypothetical protein